jgi:fused signal recognition particle receptor
MGIMEYLKEKLKGGTERWRGGIAGLFSGHSIDDAFWEELEERLLAGDVGISLTERLLERLRDEHRTKHIRETEVLRNVFVEILVELLESVPGMGAPLRSDISPSVVLLIGVNGSGKTTTAGNSLFRQNKRAKVFSSQQRTRIAPLHRSVENLGGANGNPCHSPGTGQ